MEDGCHDNLLPGCYAGNSYVGSIDHRTRVADVHDESLVQFLSLKRIETRAYLLWGHVI